MEKISKTSLQSQVFDFALLELVRTRRNSFQPIWTIDSWAKFLIWMSLNCGLPGMKESLEIFGEALGSSLTKRMRRVFFERTLEDLSLHLIADPAESHVFVMPISGGRTIKNEEACKALEEVGLNQQVSMDPNVWQLHDSLIAIPWKHIKDDR